MTTFTVCLTLTVEAETLDASLDFGLNAAEHLKDTFNDDESIKDQIVISAEAASPKGGGKLSSSVS